MSMVIIGVAAAAVVGAGASVAGANAQQRAAGKAANAQINAINSMQPLDANELNRVASKAEQDTFRNSIEFQKTADPTFAALRSQGGANILAGLKADADPNNIADASVREVNQSLKDSKAGDSEIVSKLLDRVKEDLDAGATLPPEFQAELVKAGLEGAGTSGLSIEGKGAGGVGIRTLLGSAGLDLKERREANARTNLNAADQFRTNRLEALKALGIHSSDITGAKVTRGAGGMTIGNANMPKIGLTGSEAANIAVQNTMLQNNQKLGVANARAANIVSDADAQAKGIGGVSSAVTSGLGTWVGGLLKT